LASAFRHPVAQSGTGTFRSRTGSSHLGTGLVSASALLFTPVPDCPDAGQSGEKGYIHGYTSALQAIDWDTPCTSTFGVGGGVTRYTPLVHGQQLLVLFLLYDVVKSITRKCRNGEKVSLGIGIFIFTGSQLSQFGIGISVSPVPLVTD
jgi:hypothetical protein